MATKNEELSSLLSSAGLVFLGTLLGSFSKLIERIIIGRALNPEVYGKVSIALAIMSFGVVASKAGFSQGVPRYMSRFEESADIRGAWATGMTVVSLTSICLVVILWNNVSLISNMLFGGSGSESLIRLFILAIPFIATFQIGVGAIRGLENTLYKTYAKDLNFPLSKIVILVTLLSIGVGADAAGYAYIFGGIIGIITIHYFLNKLLKLRGEIRFHTKEMVLFSTPLMISTSLSILLTKTDTIMVGNMDSTFAAGLYGAAFPLANGLVLVLSSFGFLYLPLASRLDGNGRRGELNSIYKLTTKWIFIATFPIFLIFVTFPEDILVIFFGDEYAGAAFSLVILSIGFFTNAAGGRNRETLSALGYSNYILVINLIVFILNFGMNLLLIPSQGFIGASIASAISFIVLNILTCSVLKMKFNISPVSRWSIRTFITLPLLLIPFAYVLSMYSTLSILTLPIIAALFVVVTVLVVTISGCLQSDDEILIEFIENRLGVSVPFIRRYIPTKHKNDHR